MKKFFIVFLVSATIFSCTQTDKTKTETIVNSSADKISTAMDTVAENLSKLGDSAKVKLDKFADSTEAKFKRVGDTAKVKLINAKNAVIDKAAEKLKKQ